MNTVYMIHGKQGSGKSTLAEALHKKLLRIRPSRRMRFASVLYEMHDAVLTIARNSGIKVKDIDADLLQILGTEWGRSKLGEDVWVGALYHNAMKFFEVNRDSAIVIEDCRFENELNTFSGLSVDVVKVKLIAPEELRKQRCGPKWRENTEHPSETGLDHVEDWNWMFNTDMILPDDIADMILQ